MERIVVGVDGSDGAAAALRWAVEEGAVRDVPVTAVMAWGYLDQRHADADDAFDPTYGETEALAALDAALASALGPTAAATVERRAPCDLASAALLEAAGPDDLLVVGARGLGGFKGLLLGSVSRKCLDGASGPVAVIRPVPAAGSGPIVVGVDGSDTAHRALAWALDEGRARGAEVQAVHGWTAPFVGAYPFGGASFDPQVFEETAAAFLDGLVAEADTAGVTVTKVLSYGTGGAVLLEAAESATLVVVGSRGLGGFKSWLLGSVSHQIIHHAPCSVVVVPVTD